MNKTTQIDRIARVLSQNNTGSGIAPARVAKLANVPREAVAKRVSDLRQEGVTIYSNYRTVNGARKLFYRAG